MIKKQKYEASSKEEKRVYNVVREQIKQLIKTIKNYYLLWMNDEENRKKRNREEKNYYEEELEDEIIIEIDKNNPNHLRFIYV
jgi:hypothetical protein